MEPGATSDSSGHLKNTLASIGEVSPRNKDNEYMFNLQDRRQPPLQNLDEFDTLLFNKASQAPSLKPANNFQYFGASRDNSADRAFQANKPHRIDTATINPESYKLYKLKK